MKTKQEEKEKKTLLQILISKSKSRKGDPVFDRISKDCPNRRNYFENHNRRRCLANGLTCIPDNCAPYHWMKKGN